MFELYGCNNYQVVSNLEENINAEEENMKVLNFSDPTILIQHSSVLRFYRFEVGFQVDPNQEIPLSIDDTFLMKVLKAKQNHRHMLKYLSTCILEPEAFLQCCIQFLNELLRNGILLASHKIHVNDLLVLYRRCRDSVEFQYFFHTIEFYFLKLGIKYLTLSLYEPSLKIALETRSHHLINTILVFARAQKNASILGLVNYIKEQWHPGSSNITLIKSMEQIANFSKKQLKKEDLGNIYKDFETLLRIDDINDLELSDFNSWEINLEAYQTALNYELDGKFDEAKQLYKENNLTSDMTRVDNIQKQINKEMAEREKNIFFSELKNLKS